MEANDIFCKTAKGQTEIESRSHGLSMQYRRVLILVNGSNDVSELKRLSLYPDAEDIIASLLAQGFIESGSNASPASSTTAHDYASPVPARPRHGAEAEFSSEAGELMCNTLMTYANRVRVGKLIEQIKAAGNIGQIEELVKPWYHALSETPGGMYQADDFRAEVRKLIERQKSA